MNRIAALRVRLARTLPTSTRTALVVASIIHTASTSFFKRELNKVLNQEFVRAGIQVDRPLDFYKIIYSAVKRRVRNPTSPEFDDLFQEVAINFLDRSSKNMTKQWVAYVKKQQDTKGIRNLEGILFKLAENLVRDLHRKLKYRGDHFESFSDGSEDAPGVDLERTDAGQLHNPETAAMAKDLYPAIMRQLKKQGWGPAPHIFKAVVDTGNTSYAGDGRARNMKELHREVEQLMGRSIQYKDFGYSYRKNFRREMERALKALGIGGRSEGARLLSAALQSRVAQMVFDLSEVENELVM
tara:strand:- start:19277 stop:20170 length:894 start_codon:yes stop_codon:yes gene_type:complete